MSDKSSSAELSEAINSMYRWNKGAKVCYTYLADMTLTDVNMAKSALRNCRWFSRGWTLQELIAPSWLILFDANWSMIGTKYSLRKELSQITGIDQGVISGESLRNTSVAQKMSWASERTTTRVEDMAYSLLGIFGVFMPILYGEGQNAFKRLQLEIIASSSDHSIFA